MRFRQPEVLVIAELIMINTRLNIPVYKQMVFIPLIFSFIFSLYIVSVWFCIFLLFSTVMQDIHRHLHNFLYLLNINIFYKGV